MQGTTRTAGHALDQVVGEDWQSDDIVVDISQINTEMLDQSSRHGMKAPDQLNQVQAQADDVVLIALARGQSL